MSPRAHPLNVRRLFAALPAWQEELEELRRREGRDPLSGRRLPLVERNPR